MEGIDELVHVIKAEHSPGRSHSQNGATRVKTECFQFRPGALDIVMVPSDTLAGGLC
jgi:hypothetical protein